MNTFLRIRLPLALSAILGFHGLAAATEQAIQDTLTGASTKFDWVSLNGACLTAGDGTGTIPACVGLAYYNGKTLVGGTSGRLPDVAGSGALRLTNGDTTTGTNGNNQTGAVVSNFTFGTQDGIQVTWTSVSYGGNNYNGTGADGISFFLSDGGTSASPNPPTVGALGGSLGYSCSNANGTYDGVVGGYIGIGIDEFGNFGNQGDNTDTGQGFHPGRINVRGAGSTAYGALSASATFGKYYPAGASAGTKSDAIHNTCKSGYAYNYSGVNQTDSANKVIGNGNQTHDKLPYNYPLLFSVDVPAGISLANQQAINMPTRGAAIPIVFALKITSNGLLDFSYSANGGATQTVVTGLKITANNGPLPASFRFGFSSGTGGGNNVHEITCFKAEPANLANTSAGANVQQGQVVLGASQVFLAFYHPVNWWGSMTANALLYDAATDSLTASSVATWDGGCVLTGGDCQTMTAASATSPVQVTVQGPSSRSILSWYNNTGVAFDYTALGKPAAMGDNTSGPVEVAYLRGDRSNEQTNGTATPGTMRNRTSVLADIIDSSPVWVGAPAYNYADPWQDKLNTSTTLVEGSTSYAKFKTDNASRMNMVYVGANDGLLHGFRTGTVTTTTDSSTGKVTTSLTNNDGKELIAYVPAQVVAAIHPTGTGQVGYDYSNVLYQHNFEVDGTPGTGDLYYNNAWHTWLVTGLGVGGHPNGPVSSNGTDANGNQLIPNPVGALFALDVTDPSTFSESNASSLVVGEWNSSTLPKCIDNSTCGTNMGQVVGTPLIRRLHDGTWGVIWGNGLNSASARAGIFIMHVDKSNNRTFQYLDAGPGPANGIVQVAAADLDGDHITDFVYAGDVLGRVWRFDLTATNPSTWSTSVTQIFQTATGQPITTAPLVTQVPVDKSASGLPKVLVSFGTGQKLPITSTGPETYASGTQSIYGIWDSNFTAWNATTTDSKFDLEATPNQPVPMNKLLTQTMANVTGKDGVAYRTLTGTTLCWQGTSICGSGNTQLGWKVDLNLTAGEQIIYNPAQVEDSFVVNTVIPATVAPLNCINKPPTGFTMAPSLFDGGGDNAPFSDGKPNDDGTTNSYSGLGANGSGTVTELNVGGDGTSASSGDNTHLGFETTDGGWKGPKFNRRGGKVSKVTWTKVR